MVHVGGTITRTEKETVEKKWEETKYADVEDREVAS